MLHVKNSSGQLWNKIRKVRQSNGQGQNVISMDTLHDYFSMKFSKSKTENKHVTGARKIVEDKYEVIKSIVNNDFVFSCEKLKFYIRRLKSGCSAGMEGIVAEHLKHGLDTNLISHLSNILTVCFRFGIIPESFYCGILIPLLKKTTADPMLAKNYRPIIMSNVLSKLIC